MTFVTTHNEPGELLVRGYHRSRLFLRAKEGASADMDADTIHNDMSWDFKNNKGKPLHFHE